jgi:transposase-like protein
MDEKIKFVAAVNTQQCSFAEVCRGFGISRKSGYALMRRYEQDGARGLLARSRAPHTHLNAMDEAMAEQLLQIKQGSVALFIGLDWLALGKPKLLKMRDKDSQIPGEKAMRLVIWIFLGLDFALACLAMLAMFSHA